jgi:hypothetical protein
MAGRLKEMSPTLHGKYGPTFRLNHFISAIHRNYFRFTYQNGRNMGQVGGVTPQETAHGHVVDGL